MSEPSEIYDVVVIGSGPGGYVAAIRAAQLGLKTACIERENLGGICLNWGCIPTKALLRSAEVLETLHHAKDFGIVVGDVKPDFPAIIQRSRGISDKVSKGVAFLFKKNKIDSIAGTGKLLPRAGAWKPHQIEVTAADGGTQTISTKHVIIATGARARSLPGLDLDGTRIIEYRKAMTLPAQPKSMVVLGAGAIGVEFASFYRALGTEVTIVEFLPRLVPNEDPEISKELRRAFDKRGITSLVDHKLASARVDGDRVVMSAEPRAGGDKVELAADILLVAVGVAANTENLGLEHHKVELDRGYIKTDAENRCGDNLWAIGDVIGRGLAHVASAEGVFVAEKIAGVHAEPVRYDAIPACTYCSPEIASVGDRGQGEGAERARQGRQVPVRGAGQGPRGRRHDRLRQGAVARGDRRARGGAPDRPGGDRPDRRADAREDHRGQCREPGLHDPRSSHVRRDDQGRDRGRARPRH